MPYDMDVEAFVAMARKAFRPSLRPWVLFRHGTLVGPIPEGEEPAAHAIKLMREWGPVRPGSPAGDIKVLRSKNGEWDGWIIFSHHPLIVTLVTPAEPPIAAQQDVAVGLFGRGKRDLDSRELDVVHVEPAPD